MFIVFPAIETCTRTQRSSRLLLTVMFPQISSPAFNPLVSTPYSIVLAVPLELIFRQNDSLMICGHNSFYSSPVFRSDIQLSAEILPSSSVRATSVSDSSRWGTSYSNLPFSSCSNLLLNVFHLILSKSFSFFSTTSDYTPRRTGLQRKGDAPFNSRTAKTGCFRADLRRHRGPP